MTLAEAISLISNDYLKSLSSPSPANPGSVSPSLWADLGCGSGLFTQALSHFLPAGSTVYAVDRQPSLKRQTTPNGVHIVPLERDFVIDQLDPIQPSPRVSHSHSPDPQSPHSQPLNSHHPGSAATPLLNGILMANSLHYVKDKPAFLQNLKNHLSLTSVFLIVEYDIDRPVPTWVPYPVSFASLQELFHGAGYRHIHKINEHPSLFGRGNLYAALIQ